MRRDQASMSLGHAIAIEELRSKSPDVANAVEQIEQFGLELSRTCDAAGESLRCLRSIRFPIAEKTFGFCFERRKPFEERLERRFPHTCRAKCLDACDHAVDSGEPRTQTLQTPTLAFHVDSAQKKEKGDPRAGPPLVFQIVYRLRVAYGKTSRRGGRVLRRSASIVAHSPMVSAMLSENNRENAENQK
jgi:hypothetical protein